MDKNGPDLSDLLAPVLARLDAIDRRNADLAAKAEAMRPSPEDDDLRVAELRVQEAMAECNAALARAERAESALADATDLYRRIDDALRGVVVTVEPTGQPCIDRIATLRISLHAAEARAAKAEQEMDEACDYHAGVGRPDPDGPLVAWTTDTGRWCVEFRGTAPDEPTARRVVESIHARLTSPPVAIDAGAPPPVDAARALLIEYLSRRNADNPCNPTFEECEAGPRERAVEDMRRALATVGAAVAPALTVEPVAWRAFGEGYVLLTDDRSKAAEQSAKYGGEPEPLYRRATTAPVGEVTVEEIARAAGEVWRTAGPDIEDVEDAVRAALARHVGKRIAAGKDATP